MAAVQIKRWHQSNHCLKDQYISKISLMTQYMAHFWAWVSFLCLIPFLRFSNLKHVCTAEFSFQRKLICNMTFWNKLELECVCVSLASLDQTHQQTALTYTWKYSLFPFYTTFGLVFQIANISDWRENSRIKSSKHDTQTPDIRTQSVKWLVQKFTTGTLNSDTEQKLAWSRRSPRNTRNGVTWPWRDSASVASADVCASANVLNLSFT